MSHTYFFPEPGTISGIPGTFAGVQVEVDEETSEIIKVSPLTRHPHFQASQEPDVQAIEPEKPSEQPEQETEPTESVQSEQVTEEAPPEQATQTEVPPPELPPEQPAQTEASANVEPPAEEAGDHIESEGV